jgi:hypothetical protein
MRWWDEPDRQEESIMPLEHSSCKMQREGRVNQFFSVMINRSPAVGTA